MSGTVLTLVLHNALNSTADIYVLWLALFRFSTPCKKIKPAIRVIATPGSSFSNLLLTCAR
eukprot:95181-Amphidinium_carterae.1